MRIVGNFLLLGFMSLNLLATVNETDTVSSAIPQEEWNILVNFYETHDGASWCNPWDMSVGREGASSLYGITVSEIYVGLNYMGEDSIEYHITDINLSDNYLYSPSGKFPCQIFDLPFLSSLNLSGNKLMGNISDDLSAYQDSVGRDLLSSYSLAYLDLSRNSFEGNIGAFAEKFYNLYTLDIHENCISEVSPMLPDYMSVTLHPQYIYNYNYDEWGMVESLWWSEITEETLLDYLPSIVTYNHYEQTYTLPYELYLYCDDEWDSGWSGYFCMNNGKPYWAYSWYYTEEGLIEYEPVLEPYTCNNGTALWFQDTYNTGTTFYMAFVYDAGDADFSGTVDVLDLQRIINYSFDPYTYEASFNLTAANLTYYNNVEYDDYINVQDVVLMVTLLLNKEMVMAVPLSSPYTDEGEEPAKASLAWQQNQLILSTTEPVASFELLLTGTTAEDLNWLLPEGFTVQTKEKDGVTRILVYSLSGAEIPVGESVLATTNLNKNARLVSALLADSRARKISAQLNGNITAVETLNDETACICKWDNGQLQLTTTHPMTQVRWKLVTATGQIVTEGEQKGIETGIHLLPVSDNLARGCYIFHLQSANGVNCVTKLFVE